MSRRSLLSVLALVACLAAGVVEIRVLLADPTIWPPDDFVEYWAAGRLNLMGKDPYLPDNLLPLEEFAGRELADGKAVMMWNPPWTLALAMPLGALPPRVAQLAWLAAGLAAVGASAHLLWPVFGGPANRRWVGWAVAFGFAPTYIVLRSGQISAFLVLGVALFLASKRRGWDYAAGFATVLVAIKPHLAYLLWAAILVEAVARRRGGVIAGGVAGGLFASAAALLFNPDVFSQYLAAFRDHPPAEWVSLTVGTVLRMAFGSEYFRLQFVPMPLGLAWFAWHWWNHRRAWDWAEQTPLLVLVSFLTSPYGAWHFDLVLLLLPLWHRAAQLANAEPDARTWWVIGWYAAMNAVMVAIAVAHAWSFTFAWVAPFVLALYCATGRRREPAPALAVTPA